MKSNPSIYRLKHIMLNLSQQPRYIKIITVLVIAGALVLISAYIKQNSLQTDPVKGTAIETYNLLNATQLLRDEIYHKDDVDTYLKRLDEIQHACGRIDRYYGMSQAKDVSEANKNNISQSKDLCKDLVSLSSYSEIIYVSMRDLLSADSTPRLFQTLPPFSTITRQKHIKAANEASIYTDLLKKHDVDFPSSAADDLSKLQAAIKNSKGVAYLPNLKIFQAQLLGERQQFWASYASIDALMHSLQVKLDAYCGSLNNANSTIRQCVQNSN